MLAFVDIIQPFFVALAVAIPRLLAALFLVPIFSIKLMKGMVRYSIVIALALPVAFPLMQEIQLRDIGLLSLAFIMLKEALIGFVIGFFLAMPFWIFKSVGVMIDQQRGALSGEYFNPSGEHDDSMLGSALVNSLGMVLIALGYFPGFFSVVIETYQLWPTLDWSPKIADGAIDIFIEHIALFAYKFVLYAGPIVLILLLVEGAFAVLGAYAPQLQVYFIAMPAKALAALAVLVVYAGTLWHLGASEFMEYQNLKMLLPGIFRPNGY